MAKNWWEDDPLVEQTAPTDGATSEEGNWWEADEVVTEVEPTVAPEDVRDPETGIPGGDAISKPEDVRFPSTTMYKENIDLGSPEANLQRDVDQYNSYDETDPNFTGNTIFGEPTYKNTVVPFPELKVEGKNDVGFGQMAAGVARGAVKNATVTGAAMLDELYKTITGSRSNLAEMANEAIADPPRAGELTDSLIMDGGEAAVGIVAGYAIPTAGASIATRGPKGAMGKSNIGRDIDNIKFNPAEMNATFAKALSGFGSMVGAAVTQDENTEPLVVGTILEGVPVDENGHYSEQVVAKKLNLLYDELTVGLGAQKAMQGAAAAGNIVKNITLDQLKPMYDDGTRESEAIQKVVEALNMDSPEGIAQLRQVIQDNKEILVRLDSEPNVSSVKLQRTTMSAIEEGLNETDRWRARRAMDLEAGVSHTGQTSLQRRVDQPMEATKVFQDELIESRGGSGTIDVAGNNLAKQGIDQITAARDLPVQQKNVLDQSEEFLRNRLRNDPMLGDDIKRMEGNVELDTGATSSRAEDIVMGDIRQTADTIKDVSKRLYDAIPDGEPIDVDSLAGVMKYADEYLPPAVKHMIADEDTILDYKKLHNDILPLISKRITQLEKTGADPDAIDALTEVRRNITETQADFIEQHGSDAAKEYSRNARSYYKEDVIPFSKTPSTKELFNTRGKTEYHMKQDAQDAVRSLSDDSKGGSEAVLDLLSRPENKGKPDAIFSVYLGNVAKDWGRKLADPDGIDKLDPSDILNRLDNVGVTFKKRFPAQVKQVETLATELKAAKGDVKKQRELLREYEVKGRELEQDVYSHVLGKFIHKGEGGAVSPKQGAYDIFKGLLNNEKSGDDIDAIVKKVRDSGDEVAQKGLESAYLSYLKERITPRSSTGFSASQASRFVDEDEIKRLKGYGLKIFKNPEVVEAYDAVVSTLIKERDKRSPAGLPLQTKGGLAQAAKSAIAFATHMTFGVLNPTSTRIKNISNTVLGRSNGDKMAMELMEKIHADPDFTLRLLKDLGNKKTSGLSKDGKNAMWKIATYAGLYSGDDKEQFDKDWDNYQRKEKLRTEMDSITKRQDRKDKEEFNNIR